MNKSIGTLITALLILLMAGSAMCATYDSNVTLENKNPSTWEVISDDVSAVVEYNASGDEFAWHATGTVPNFGGTVAECYALIYYADEDDRFENWGGANPGAIIGKFQVDACTGDFDTSGETELGINMPEYPDWNINPDPFNTYCGEGGDGYENCCGAKLWIVPCSDYDAPEMTAWNPDDYLFETDLIWYDDTDASANYEPEVLYVDPDGACYAAGEEVEITAIVEDMDGYFDLENMVVEADLSAFGVDDPVVLNFTGTTDCITGGYSGSAVVKIATTCECYEGCMEFDVTATDPSQESDTGEGCMDVEPGPCDHLNFTSIGYTTLLKYEYTEVNIEWSTFMWWDYQLYFDALLVTCQDEFGNDLCDIECDPIVTTTGHASTVHDEFIIPEWLLDLPGTLVIVWNDEAVETCTLTAFCEDKPAVTEATIDIDFLEPIIQVNATADDDYLFHAGDCACDMDYTNVSAQILDQYGEPIPMPNVPVQFLTYGYDGGELAPEWSFTDENGIATSELCIVGEENGTVQARAVAEARMGTDSVDVIEPPCYITMFADPDELVKNDECGSYECSYITGQLWDQYDAPVEVEGLPIALYVNEGDEWQVVHTNESGGIEATVCTEHHDMELGTNVIYAEGCFAEGEVYIEMVEPELCELELVAVEPIMVPFCPGDVQKYVMFCYDQNGNPMCCPENCSCSEPFNFTVENELIGEWDDNYSYDGLNRLITNNLTANATGTTMVNVTCGDITTDIEVVVEDSEPACTNVVITTEDPVDVVIGDTVTFTASCTDQFGDPFTCTDLTWTSDNETVGTMGSPTLTALAPGITNVTATGCGDSNSIQVNVSTAVCANVVITTEDPVDVVIGDTVTFTASCTDQFGDPFTCTDLTWDSDNETVGTMGSPTLTALAPGVTNVTATGCGDSDPIQVNVSAVVVTNGDFDGDGDIDFTDFVEFAGAYGATSCEDSNYDAIADFDGDCDVDFTDFVEFAGAYTD